MAIKSSDHAMNFQTILSQVNLSYLPYISVVILIALITYYAHKAKEGNFNFYDLVLDPATNKASITRVWQNVGAGTGTVIVIQLAVNGKLDDTTFAIYLGALGVSEAFSRFIGAKYYNNPQGQQFNPMSADPNNPPPPPAQ
jgi:hypothetical protein